MNEALRKRVRVSAGKDEHASVGIIDSQSIKTTQKGALEDTMGTRR